MPFIFRFCRVRNHPNVATGAAGPGQVLHLGLCRFCISHCYSSQVGSSMGVWNLLNRSVERSARA